MDFPIENEIEKAQNFSGAASIEEFGIAKFNEECRKIVLRYTEEWKAIVNRWDVGSILTNLSNDGSYLHGIGLVGI